MRNLLTLLLLLSFFFACSSDDPIMNSDGKDEGSKNQYSKTDSIFEYRFGSSIEEVKPDIIRSPELAFSYNRDGSKPGTVFHFKDKKLTTVSKYYTASEAWVNGQSFIRDVNKLNPPYEIILRKYPEEYESWMKPSIAYFQENSLSWKYNHYNVILKCINFSFDSHNIEMKFPYFAIEFSKL